MTISSTVYRARLRSARGSVAIELAVILVALIFILPGIFFYGYIFLQYNVAKNASYGAARYLAASGQWAGLSGSARREIAIDMARRLAAEGGMKSGEDDLDPTAQCGPARPNCNGEQPTDTVTVVLEWRMPSLGPQNEWLSLLSTTVNPKTNKAP